MGGELVSGALQAGAFSMLERFNSLMLPHGKQWAELVQAKVPLHTVESLYPFELSDYVPFIRSMFIVPQQLEAIAFILGDQNLNHAFKTLPDAAAASADRIIWFDSFFDGDEALSELWVKTPENDEINGNAIFLMKQWGYLLLYLYECFKCPSLPWSGEFERWYDDVRAVGHRLLDQIDSHGKSSIGA